MKWMYTKGPPTTPTATTSTPVRSQNFQLRPLMISPHVCDERAGLYWPGLGDGCDASGRCLGLRQDVRWKWTAARGRCFRTEEPLGEIRDGARRAGDRVGDVLARVVLHVVDGYAFRAVL